MDAIMSRSNVHCDLIVMHHTQKNARFCLPLDLHQLEDMSVTEYLRKFLVISPRKKTAYHKIFLKNKDTDSNISRKAVIEAVMSTSLNFIQREEVELLIDILHLDMKEAIDETLFHAIMAIGDRLIVAKILLDEDNLDSVKETLEIADFQSFQWKIRDIAVNPHLLYLFECLGHCSMPPATTSATDDVTTDEQPPQATL